MLSLLREGFFKRGETWADLKCEGKEPSVSDKLKRDKDTQFESCDSRQVEHLEIPRIPEEAALSWQCEGEDTSQSDTAVGYYAYFLMVTLWMLESYA